ncbi:MAG: sporulation protein YabP [Firmicutes bacterium]|nr:sporulation protein YabP [Bacillota bacterium]
MNEEKKFHKHSVVIEKREKTTVTGILDVISFDEELVIAETEMGVILLKGENLHVNKIDLDKGDLDIDGKIISLVYEEKGTSGKSSSIFDKIFK